MRSIDPSIQELDKASFRLVIDEIAETDEAVVLLGWHHKGVRPVGFLGVERDRHIISPNVLWFPWVTLGNRMEALVSYIEAMRAENVVLFHIPFDEKRFWLRLGDFGVMKRIGTFDNYFAPDVGAQVWQSRM